jgi:hypothetical protein
MGAADADSAAPALLVHAPERATISQSPTDRYITHRVTLRHVIAYRRSRPRADQINARVLASLVSSSGSTVLAGSPSIRHSRATEGL